MVRGGDGIELSLRRPLRKEAIAFVPGALLDRSGGLVVPNGGEDRLRDAEGHADGAARLRFFAAAGPKRGIEGGGFDLARARARSEQQQRETVGAARDGDADAR